jgi:hypothetical protein
MGMEKFKIGALVQSDILGAKDSKIVFVDTLNNRVCVETDDKKGWKIEENMDAKSTMGLDKILESNKLYWWVWEHQVKKITDIPLDDAAKLAESKKELEAAVAAKAAAEAEKATAEKARVAAEESKALAAKKTEERLAVAKANETKALEKAAFLAKEKDLLVAETAALKTKLATEKQPIVAARRVFQNGEWIIPNRTENVPVSVDHIEAYEVRGFSDGKTVIRVPAGWSATAKEIERGDIVPAAEHQDELYWALPYENSISLASPAQKRAGVFRDRGKVNESVRLMESAVPQELKTSNAEFIIKKKDVESGTADVFDTVSKKTFAVRFDQIKYLLGLGMINFNSNENQKESKEPVMANEDGGVVATFKKDAVSAGYRVAGRKLSKVAQQGLVMLLKSQGMKSKEIKSLMSLAETDMGRAVIAQIIGQGLPRIPGLKNDPRVLRLSEELRVESMSNGMEMTLDGLLGGLSAQFLPQIQAIISELPHEEVAVVTPVATTKARIEAKGDAHKAEAEEEAEEEAHHTTKRHARAA